MAVGGRRAFAAKAVALPRAWNIRACFMDRVVFKFSGDGGLMNMKPRSNLCDIPSFQKTGLAPFLTESKEGISIIKKLLEFD